MRRTFLLGFADAEAEVDDGGVDVVVEVEVLQAVWSLTGAPESAVAAAASPWLVTWVIAVFGIVVGSIILVLIL